MSRAASPRAARSRRGAAFSLLLLVALVGAAACTDATSTPSANASGSAALSSALPSRSPIPRDLCANLGSDCTLEAGRYEAQLFQPDVTFTLATGWLNNVYSPRAMQILYGETAGISFVSGELLPRAGNLGSSARDLVTYLAARPGLTAQPIRDVTVGGLPAVALDVVVGKAVVALFDRPIAGSQNEAFQISPTEHARFLALDVNGERLLIVIEALPPLDFTTFLRDHAQPVIDSLGFPSAAAS